MQVFGSILDKIRYYLTVGDVAKNSEERNRAGERQCFCQEFTESGFMVASKPSDSNFLVKRG